MAPIQKGAKVLFGTSVNVEQVTYIQKLERDFRRAQGLGFKGREIQDSETEDRRNRLTKEKSRTEGEIRVQKTVTKDNSRRDNFVTSFKSALLNFKAYL